MLTHRLSEFRVVTFQVLGSCEELAPVRAALSPGLRCESGAHLKALFLKRCPIQTEAHMQERRFREVSSSLVLTVLAKRRRRRCRVPAQ